VNVLVTGSSGLIGSEAVQHYDAGGHRVIGVDNNMRREFFGSAGDTTWNLRRLQARTSRFTHVVADVRDREAMGQIFERYGFDLVVHCAAQPSHDKAKEIPVVDFEVNALGTVNLLEATRRHCPGAVFILLSTNKVYGDAPNELPMVEGETRWDYARPEDGHGIDETCRIDQSLHSLFGASKAAADIVAQEYGRYFGMKVCVFRGGCLTGPSHSGVELHGFLSYLVQVAVEGREYRINGYKGKQVRDQLHSHDVVRAFDAVAARPRCGEVYNLGGGRANSVSVLEAISMVERAVGRPVRRTYAESSRVGDHICYISDLRKLRAHYPQWSVTVGVESIVAEMVEAACRRSGDPDSRRTAASSTSQPDAPR
jgi:CDP-paratose 2-epimerase